MVIFHQLLRAAGQELLEKQWCINPLGAIATLDTPLVDFSCLPINRVNRSSVKFNGDEDGGPLLASLCFTAVGLNNTIAVVGLFPVTTKPAFDNDSWP